MRGFQLQRVCMETPAHNMQAAQYLEAPTLCWAARLWQRALEDDESTASAPSSADQTTACIVARLSDAHPHLADAAYAGHPAVLDTSMTLADKMAELPADGSGDVAALHSCTHAGSDRRTHASATCLGSASAATGNTELVLRIEAVTAELHVRLRTALASVPAVRAASVSLTQHRAAREVKHEQAAWHLWKESGLVDTVQKVLVPSGVAVRDVRLFNADSDQTALRIADSSTRSLAVLQSRSEPVSRRGEAFGHLEHMKQLTCVKLYDAPDFVRTICHLFCELAALPRLQHLAIVRCELGALSRYDAELHVPALTRLTALHLSGNRHFCGRLIDNVSYVLLASLATLTSLRELRLNGTGLELHKGHTSRPTTLDTEVRAFLRMFAVR